MSQINHDRKAPVCSWSATLPHRPSVCSHSKHFWSLQQFPLLCCPLFLFALTPGFYDCCSYHTDKLMIIASQGNSSHNTLIEMRAQARGDVLPPTYTKHRKKSGRKVSHHFADLRHHDSRDSQGVFNDQLSIRIQFLEQAWERLICDFFLCALWNVVAVQLTWVLKCF